jgi:hypothetical protein
VVKPVSRLIAEDQRQPRSLHTCRMRSRAHSSSPGLGVCAQPSTLARSPLASLDCLLSMTRASTLQYAVTLVRQLCQRPRRGGQRGQGSGALRPTGCR